MAELEGTIKISHGLIAPYQAPSWERPFEVLEQELQKYRVHPATCILAAAHPHIPPREVGLLCAQQRRTSQAPLAAELPVQRKQDCVWLPSPLMLSFILAEVLLTFGLCSVKPSLPSPLQLPGSVHHPQPTQTLVSISKSLHCTLCVVVVRVSEVCLCLWLLGLFHLEKKGEKKGKRLIST